MIGCSNCTSQSDCLACAEEYYLENDPDRCETCPSNCPSCTGPNIEDCDLITPTAKALTKIIESTAIAALATSAASLACGADPNTLLNQLTIIQSLTTLLFLNVDYPPNFELFLGIFKLGKMGFVPNPFAWFVKDFDENAGNSPYKFRLYGFDGIFLKDVGNIIFLLLISVALDLACRCVSPSMKRMYKFSVLLRTKLGMPFAFRTFVSTSTILLIALILQIFSPDFTRFFAILSWAFCLVVGLFFMGLSIAVLIVYRMMKKATEETSKKSLLEKYSILFEGFIPVGMALPKPFMAVILLRKLLSILTLILLYYIPILQVLFQELITLGYAYMLYKMRPYILLRQQRIFMVIETLLTVIHLLIIVIYWDASKTIGWILIGLCGSVIVLFQIYSIVDIILSFCEQRKDKRAKSAGKDPAVMSKYEVRPPRPSQTIKGKVENPKIALSEYIKSSMEGGPLSPVKKRAKWNEEENYDLNTSEAKLTQELTLHTMIPTQSPLIEKQKKHVKIVNIPKVKIYAKKFDHYPSSPNKKKHPKVFKTLFEDN